MNSCLFWFYVKNELYVSKDCRYEIIGVEIMYGYDDGWIPFQKIFALCDGRVEFFRGYMAFCVSKSFILFTCFVIKKHVLTL